MSVFRKMLKNYDRRQQGYNATIADLSSKTKKYDPTKAFRRPGSRNPRKVGRS